MVCMWSYGPLLRTPGALGFTLAAMLGRMPIAMLGIGTVLLVQDRRDSYALAGLVGAAYAVGLAVIGPGVSRFVDRRGQRRVLPYAVALTAVGIVAVVALAGSSAPAWTMLLPAAVMATSASQLGSCARARWGLVLATRPAELARAFAWESVVDEMVFVLGPLVVVLCAAADPALGLLLALAFTIAGTAWFVLQRDTEPPVHQVGDRGPSALASGGLRTLVGVMLFVGVLFGTVEVSMVAFAKERGSSSGAGVLLALVAFGSAVAGLAYGAVHFRRPLPWRLSAGLAFLAVGLVPLLLAPTVALMAPAALLAGLAISPTLIAAFALAEVLVPPAARTEGYSWLNSGLGIGVAGGFAASGVVAEAAGARTAFVVALGGALVAGGVAALWRRTLTPIRDDTAVRGTGDGSERGLPTVPLS